MAEASINSRRLEPYRNFKFRVKWDGREIAGVSRVSALKRSTDVIDFREGGDHSTSHRLPGVTKFDPITLERGVSHDADFEQWANMIFTASAKPGQNVPQQDFRKDIVLEIMNETGEVELAYRIFRCWVSEFQALPDLDANSNAVVIEHLVLQNEGWERDDGGGD